jgi:FMN phosphatase YigB (HAD superfamily)
MSGRPPTSRPRVIVWDIGNVFIAWNPRNLYRGLFPDTEEGRAEMEHFLANVVSMEGLNRRLDLGERCHDLCLEAAAAHPHVDPELIHAYDQRWQEMVSGPIEQTFSLFARTKAAGVRSIALSNFGEQFYPTIERFPELATFDGRVISCEVGLVKPDAAIFELLLDRYELTPGECLFVDDSAANVATADQLGFHSLITG